MSLVALACERHVHHCVNALCSGSVPCLETTHSYERGVMKRNEDEINEAA